MKLLRHLGLMIALLWCAVMVVAPMAAAAGVNQGIDPGNNQVQQGPGPGSMNNPPGNGQGSGLQGMPPQRIPGGNMSDYGTMNPPENGDPANITVVNWTDGSRHPPGNLTGMNMTNFQPPGDPANMTALNWTDGPHHPRGNLTGMNMTDFQSPGDPANMTALNQTWHGDGNLTPPSSPAQNDQAGQDQEQIQDQVNSTGDLVTMFLRLLKVQA